MPKMQINKYFNKPSKSFIAPQPTIEIKLKLLAEKLRQQIQANNSQTFEKDYIVTQTLGSFRAGDSVKGLSFEQIFIKLLGLQLAEVDVPDELDIEPDGPGIPAPELPENPTTDQIIDYIVAEQTAIHQVNIFGELEEIPYQVKIYTEASYAQAPEKVETVFYEVIDGQGKVTEAGYQHMTELKEMYYMVALPEYMSIGENIEIQTWDDISQCWTNAQTTLTKLPEDIGDAFADAGLAVPIVPEGYTLWANLADIDAGTIFRFVLV